MIHAVSHLLSNTSVVKGSTEERGRKQSMFCAIILQFRHSLKIGKSSTSFLFFGKHTSFHPRSQSSSSINIIYFGVKRHNIEQPRLEAISKDGLIQPFVGKRA